MPQQSLSALQTSLLAALAFFDIFEYPLTLSELVRFRYRSGGDGVPEASPSDVLAALATPEVGGKGGYYFLRGRERFVGQRLRRYRLAEAKFARARRVARWCSRLPSVRLVAVCNSLAISNADEESDIDLFIVCRPGTVWLTRFLIVGCLAALGMRPTPRRHADTICASFFVSERALDLSALALRPADTYLRYWIASLVPVYDAGGVFDACLAANSWISDRLPGFQARSEERTAKSAALPSASRPTSLALRLMERWAKRNQTRRFPRVIRAMANRDSRVVISDDILKFHVDDRRRHFEDQFRKRLRALALVRAGTVPAIAS